MRNSFGGSTEIAENILEKAAATDITEFIPYICIAQELYIEPILGNALMDELKAQAAANDLTTPNSDLIVKLAPALSFYAVYQALPFHWAAIVNKGVTIRESENSKGVDIKDIAQLRRWMLNDADILRNQLIDFMHRHKENYPLWNPQRGCDTGRPSAGQVLTLYIPMVDKIKYLFGRFALPCSIRYLETPFAGFHQVFVMPIGRQFFAQHII